MSNKINVLCVDDDEIVLRSLSRLLSLNKLTFKTIQDPKIGLEFIKEHHIDVIVCDMRMPEIDGAEFFAQAQQLTPDTQRILLTGFADIEKTIEAINRGHIHTYIQKPWQNELLLRAITEGIEKRQLKLDNLTLTKKIKVQNKQLKELNETLEQQVEKRTQQIKKVLKQLEQANLHEKGNHRATFELLFNFINANPYLDGILAQNIASTAVEIGKQLKLDKAQLEEIEIAGYLAQIGLLAMDPSLYSKPFNELNEQQRKLYYSHPSTAQLMLMPATHLHQVSDAIYHQYEQYNGNGLPKGLKGKDIPLGAMILAVARDFWHYINHVASELEDKYTLAIEHIKLQQGTCYHPQVVAALDKCAIKCSSEQKVGSMQIVNASQLTTKMVLGHALRSHTGIVLLPKGHVFTVKSIEKLKQLESKKPTPFRIIIKN